MVKEKYAVTGPPRIHKGRPSTLIYPVRMRTRLGDWIDTTYWVVFPDRRSMLQVFEARKR